MSRQPSPVPQALVSRIDNALGDLAAARAELDTALAGGPSLQARRAAHAQVTAAFEAADQLLRQATRLARDHSHQRGFYRTWSHWRHQLSRLDTAKQVHLFAEADDLAIPLGTVRAVDTGMAGPAIGDLIHGESRRPGSRARYGLDVEATLVGAGRISSRATSGDAARGSRTSARPCAA